MSKQQIMFRFIYFGELFLFLKFAGVLHCSWGWALLFYAIDIQEGCGFYRKVSQCPPKP